MNNGAYALRNFNVACANEIFSSLTMTVTFGIFFTAPPMI